MSRSNQLEKKCGRLIVGRLPALELPEDSLAELKKGGIGGITLFRENADTVEQLAALVYEIHANSKHIPVVTADQEGGAVQRFNPALSSIPSAMAYAACPDRDLAKEVMDGACKQLKLLGLNMVLAPVLDVISHPLNPIVSTRSFGSIPGIVERNAREVIDAIAANGLIPVGKHFPGHGATVADSHLELAVSEVDTNRLWNVDLKPFKNCLESLPAILTGHIWVKCVDENPLPASLSPNITTAILKDYLGFDGLVVTDDMTMKGLTESSDIKDACPQAIKAGNHLLLICGDLELSIEARDSLVKAVLDGELDEALIDKAFEKVNELFNQKAKTRSLPHKSKKAMTQLKKLIEEINEKSLEVAVQTPAAIKGKCPVIIEEEEWVVLVPDHPRYSLDLAKYLQHYCDTKFSDRVSIVEKRYPVNPDFEENKNIAGQMRGKNCIFVSFRCLLNEGQMQLGQMVSDQVGMNKQVAVVPDTPLDFEGLPDWPCILVSFDPSDRAMEGLARAMIQMFDTFGGGGATYFSRLLEGVTVINRNPAVQF